MGDLINFRSDSGVVAFRSALLVGPKLLGYQFFVRPFKSDGLTAKLRK